MNEIGTSKNLINLCVDALYDQGKTIVENSGKKQHQVQSTLHNLIKVLNSWSSTNIVQQYKDEEWIVCIQDLGQAGDSITLTLSLHSSEEFGRFEAFLRHLSSNWFRDIKAQKLDNAYLSFVVTQPVPVLLNIFPQQYTNVDKPLVLSTSASSHVAKVSGIMRRLLHDFRLCVQNESGKMSGDLKEKYETKETIRSQSSDKYPEFQTTGKDSFPSDFCYNFNTPSEVLLEQLKQAYTSALHSNQKSQFKDQRLAFEPSLEVKRLQAENGKLKKIIESWSYEKEAKTEELELQINKLKKKCNEMAMALEQKDTEIQETLSELGRLNVELTRVQNERKRDELFTKTYKRHSASTQTLEIPEWSTTSLDTRTPDNQSTSAEMNRSDDGSNQHEKHHGQESVNETACLSDIPRTSVDGSIYNNYKLLFLRIASDLLNDDVQKLKQWVETEFQIDTSGDVNAILLELDRKKIISITDLSRLKRFFETSPRYDLICLIDSFLLGDYGQLKKTSRSRGSSNRGANSQNGLTFQRFAQRPQWPPQAATRGSYTAMSRGPAEQSRDNAPSVERKFQSVSRANAREPQIGTTPHTTYRPDAGNGLASRKPNIVALQRPSTSACRAKETVRSINNTTQQQGVLVTDGGTREQHEVQASDSTIRAVQGNNTSRYTNPGSNGQKLSKFQRSDDDDDSQWLCSHYKRHCYVKFECCDKFWPCHRCHNNQSTCGRRKLKSRDTVQVKCAACNQEQPFAQYCSRCNAKFARYFCGLCKHLTGTDDNPYHCEKCGICRIHGDRSFHCDVCGVCLDVQLRGNHKCRAGSAHDECCICLEDAFTGCQILPCSHKVHKECATQMIRSGITRCPICRESFAHKLERRPFKKPP